VELSANVARTPGDENWVVIATAESDPVVVRGRSPGHYKDNGRRDSQASMDPDRGHGHGHGHGHGGDGPPVSHPQGGYASSMNWMSTHRPGGHFGGSTYRQARNDGFSPSSLASCSTLTGTPVKSELSLTGSHTPESSGTLSPEESALTPLSEESTDMFWNSEHRRMSLKRSHEGEDDDEHIRYHLPGPFTEGMSSMGEYSAMPYSKLLCASS